MASPDRVPDTSKRVNVPESPTPRYSLGVLFVHGIGAQRRGETLAEFGGAIYGYLREGFQGLHDRWVRRGASSASIQAWYDTAAGRQVRQDYIDGYEWAPEALRELLEIAPASEGPSSVALLEAGNHFNEIWIAGTAALTNTRLTTLTDLEAPAHTDLVVRRMKLDSPLEHHERWLLAESWWAETFSAPRFSSLARWGFGVVPWTIGSHFGARVRRIWSERAGSSGLLSRSWWTCKVIRAIVSLLGSLVLSIAALGALTLLLALALLPIPSLRAALGTFQRKVASSLGDSYILVTRPIEAATIIGQVQRDLDWLARRCERVAVVAHSQGAAVAYETLRVGRPNNLRLLITFGSGLRKLWEIREILGPRGSLRSSAALTLIGFVVGIFYLLALIAPFWYARNLRDVGEPLPALGVIAMFVVIALCGLVIATAGLRDLVAGIDMSSLRRQMRGFARSGVRWVDCYSSADPVPNGPLPIEVRVGREDSLPAEFPQSIEVCNEASISRDHNTYWLNQDEFVTLVVGLLAEAAESPPPIVGADPISSAAVRRRRRWRIAWLVAIRSIAGLSAVAAVVQYWDGWKIIVGYSVRKSGAWLSSLVGVASPSIPSPATGDVGPALGILLAVIVVYGIVRTLWRRWDNAEMQAVIRRLPPPSVRLGLLVVVAAQVTFGAGIALGNADSLPVFFAVMTIAAPLVFVVTQPKAPLDLLGVTSTLPPDQAAPLAPRTGRFLWNLASIGILIFGMWLLIKDLAGGLQWILRLVLPPHLVPDFRASVASVITLIGVPVLVRIYVIYRANSRRRREPERRDILDAGGN